MNSQPQIHTHFIPKNGNKNLLTTWQSNDEGIKKQLDYIMISKKHRNRVTQTKTKGSDNVNSEHRRKLILIKLKIKLKNENNSNSDNSHIDFNIENLRGDPSNIFLEK